MITQADISRMAAEHGFSAAYCFAPQAEDCAPEEIKTLVLLTRSHIPGGRLVDLFYPCSNAAYHAAQTLAAEITDRIAVPALRLSHLRLKPMCARLPAFGRGRNTLNYLPERGSRFCMELLGLTEEVLLGGEDAPYPAHELPCATCRRCEQACPTGAITQKGFLKERCLRFHMLNGKPTPPEYRPYMGGDGGSAMVLGCDRCQHVCPANQAIEAQRRPQEDEFTLNELLRCDDDTLRRFAALYGSNYAIRNRILAQAALAAGNSGDAKLIPLLERLAASPSATVAEHAAWAIDRLKNQNQLY